MAENEPGLWESLGYHNHADPWRAALPARFLVALPSDVVPLMAMMRHHAGLRSEPESSWSSPRSGGLAGVGPTLCHACGATLFVEEVADALVGLGHDSTNVKTERFGPTGG